MLEQIVLSATSSSKQAYEEEVTLQWRESCKIEINTTYRLRFLNISILCIFLHQMLHYYRDEEYLCAQTRCRDVKGC